MKEMKIPQLVSILLIVGLVTVMLGVAQEEGPEDLTDTENMTIKPPSGKGSITIQGEGTYEYDVAKISSIRGDIFNSGYFSVFDILVYLDSTGDIDMVYHFDATLNTHVIDSINGEENWWYEIYYDGGWPERNSFRMDHYPYKDGSTIRIFQEKEETIDNIHDIFRAEVIRKAENGGATIIPEVIIRGRSETLRFKNVTVWSHNLRNDTFCPGTITAIDVIMSMGDQDLITYKLQWYDSIGTAKIVRNYWVDGINDNIASGTCGFVYEAGSYSYVGFRGNHIHLPSDHRVINSPEYVEFFWICL